MDLRSKLINILWGRNIGGMTNAEDLADCLLQEIYHHYADDFAWMNAEHDLLADKIKELETELMLKEFDLEDATAEAGLRLHKRRRNFP